MSVDITLGAYYYNKRSKVNNECGHYTRSVLLQQTCSKVNNECGHNTGNILQHTDGSVYN